MNNAILGNFKISMLHDKKVDISAVNLEYHY